MSGPLISDGGGPGSSSQATPVLEQTQFHNPPAPEGPGADLPAEGDHVGLQGETRVLIGQEVADPLSGGFLGLQQSPQGPRLVVVSVGSGE